MMVVLFLTGRAQPLALVVMQGREDTASTLGCKCFLVAPGSTFQPRSQVGSDTRSYCLYGGRPCGRASRECVANRERRRLLGRSLSHVSLNGSSPNVGHERGCRLLWCYYRECTPITIVRFLTGLCSLLLCRQNPSHSKAFSSQ